MITSCTDFFMIQAITTVPEIIRNLHRLIELSSTLERIGKMVISRRSWNEDGQLHLGTSLMMPVFQALGKQPIRSEYIVI
ncbi:hypothetical protein WA026_010239 [Henosepilachna vigintioctopunctata]|uniref:Uncharacterized protein n=1 Tax=Henosepilachna vigintioctopunctata TaxID=420089 RepID=A0AAW1UBH5_9CUCU